MDKDTMVLAISKAQLSKFSGIISKGFSKATKRLIREFLYGIQATKDVKLSRKMEYLCSIHEESQKEVGTRVPLGCVKRFSYFRKMFSNNRLKSLHKFHIFFLTILNRFSILYDGLPWFVGEKMISSEEILVSVPSIDQILGHIQFIGKEVKEDPITKGGARRIPLG